MVCRSWIGEHSSRAKQKKTLNTGITFSILHKLHTTLHLSSGHINIRHLTHPVTWDNYREKANTCIFFLSQLARFQWVKRYHSSKQRNQHTGQLSLFPFNHLRQQQYSIQAICFSLWYYICIFPNWLQAI
jgi:hypothetical protein